MERIVARTAVKGRRTIGLTVLLLVFVGATLTAHGGGPDLATAYSNKDLGFVYLPPLDMKDKTDRVKRETKARADALHTANTLNLLLAMSSGQDDQAPSWHSLAIETYPREAFRNLDDLRAEARMSARVARCKEETALPRQVVVSGQSFAISIFGLKEGPVTRRAVVWTTIRKDQLLSFAFVANSPDQLKTLTESMKTLQFF